MRFVYLKNHVDAGGGTAGPDDVTTVKVIVVFSGKSVGANVPVCVFAPPASYDNENEALLLRVMTQFVIAKLSAVRELPDQVPKNVGPSGSVVQPEKDMIKAKLANSRTPLFTILSSFLFFLDQTLASGMS